MRRGQQVCSKRNWSQDTCWYILAGCPLPTFICGENHWGLKSAQIVGETLLLVTKCGKYHHVWWLYPHVCWSHPNLFCINTNTCLLYIYIYMYTYVVSPPHPPILVAWPYTTIHVLYLHAGLMPPFHCLDAHTAHKIYLQHFTTYYCHTVSFSSHAAMYWLVSRYQSQFL